MVPQSRTPTILLTRPEAQSIRFAAQLRTRFPQIRVVISPLIAPRFLQPTLPMRYWTGLIFTSETGVMSAQRIAAGGAVMPSLAFCVGDHTAAVAAAAGFTPRSAGGDATALLALILTQTPTGPLLHLHGAEPRGDLESRLVEAGIETVSLVSYRQETQSLTPTATARLQGQSPVLAPLFSPRTAEILAAQCRAIGSSAPLTVVAISAAVATAAPPTLNLIVAERPDATAMLDAIAAVLLSEP